MFRTFISSTVLAAVGLAFTGTLFAASLTPASADSIEPRIKDRRIA